jgi:hypothetical protein
MPLLVGRYYVDTRAHPPHSTWDRPPEPPAGVAQHHPKHIPEHTTHDVCKVEMSSTPYELWCLVEGEEIPFSVSAPPTTTIDGLKIAIKERIKIDLAAYRLILWKVRSS